MTENNPKNQSKPLKTFNEKKQKIRYQQFITYFLCLLGGVIGLVYILNEYLYQPDKSDNVKQLENKLHILEKKWETQLKENKNIIEKITALNHRITPLKSSSNASPEPSFFKSYRLYILLSAIENKINRLESIEQEEKFLKKENFDDPAYYHNLMQYTQSIGLLKKLYTLSVQKNEQSQNKIINHFFQLKKENKDLEIFQNFFKQRQEDKMITFVQTHPGIRTLFEKDFDQSFQALVDKINLKESTYHLKQKILHLIFE